MDTSTLLQNLENVNHSQRVKRMVEIGAQSKDSAGARTILNTLSSGSIYERALALESFYGSRNIKIAREALNSSSRHLKQRALQLIGLFGTDAEFLEALRKSPPYLQISTLRHFRDERRKRKRLPVIEAFLEELEKTHHDPILFRRLLPPGSRRILEQHLPSLIDKFSLADWNRLAIYHPDVTQTTLQDWLNRSSGNDHHLISTINSILRKWLVHEHVLDSALNFFEAAQKRMPRADFPVKSLAAKRPKEVFQIILDSDEELEKDVLEAIKSKILRKLPLAQFLELFGRYPEIIDSWNSPASFDNLTFEQRRAVYKLVKVGWRNQGGILTRLSLEKLPTEDSIIEARRHIKSSKFVAKPEGKIEYIALLPWDEAMELQTPYLRSCDADVRSSALKYETAAKFDDSHLSDELQLVLGRKNEQDPVKEEMMEGLAEIPPSRWKESHLNDLEAILRNVLDTSDTSTATLYSITKLVTGIISFYPRWASNELATMVRERNPRIGRIILSGNAPVRDVMAIVAEEMSTVLRNLVHRKDGDSLENLASAFGTLIKYWPEFLNICESILNDPDMDTCHEVIFNILKEHQPQILIQVIPKLLQDNNEVISGHEVMKFVLTRQQQFLWSYLKAGEDTKLTRREGLMKLSYSRHGFWRWTQSQQESFAAILVDEINDENLESEKKLINVKQLSALAFPEPVHLIKLAGNNDSPILQESALKSLGKLDGGQGVPVLIAALSDRRARLAIYALRTVLKSLPKSELLTLLRTVPQTKLTVAKETLRLIGELGNDAAFEYLLEKAKENLHIDVRLALSTHF